MPPINPIPINAPRKVEGALSARERAIAKFQEGSQPAEQPTAQTHPVQNPSQVSPEELSAIKAPTSTENRHDSTNVDPSSPPAQSASEAPKAQVEQPKAASTEPPKEPLSAQYAQLARREKAMRAQAQQLKAQAEALKAQEAAMKAKEAEMLGQYIPKSKLKENPLEVLSENDVSYDQITQSMLNAPDPVVSEFKKEIARLQAEVKSLRDDTEGTKKSFQDREQQQYQQAIHQIKTEASQLVKGNEAFELIDVTDSVGDVVELIEKTFKVEKYLMTVEEAARAVEAYLEDEAMRIANLKKVQSRLKPKQEEAPKAATPAAAKETSPTEKPQMTTLTNSVTATRPLSRRERAILAFNGKLK